MKRLKSLLRQIGEANKNPKMQELVDYAMKGFSVSEIISRIATIGYKYQMRVDFEYGEITIQHENVKIYISDKKYADYEITFFDDTKEEV